MRDRFKAYDDAQLILAQRAKGLVRYIDSVACTDSRIGIAKGKGRCAHGDGRVDREQSVLVWQRERDQQDSATLLI